jgi:choline dehydrogenase
VLPTDEDLGSRAQLESWLRETVTTGHHVSGTCKMGPASDPLAVVDAQTRVHGVDGLRVADLSIAPTIPRANTNATAIMIGERVSDFLLGAHTPVRDESASTQAF